jgi:hypothetical protein
MPDSDYVDNSDDSGDDGLDSDPGGSNPDGSNPDNKNTNGSNSPNSTSFSSSPRPSPSGIPSSVLNGATGCVGPALFLVLVGTCWW